MADNTARLQHYDIKSLAKSLRLSSIDVIKTSRVDIESHWYRSAGPADLYFWKTTSKIVKHQVSLFNQVVEWNEFDGVKTGFVSEEDDDARSDTVIFDEEINETVVEQVLEFLTRVEQIDGQILNQLIANYRFYNRWPALRPLRKIKQIVKKFTKK